MSFRCKVAAIGLALSIAIGGSQALANQEIFSELEQAASSIRQLELLEPLDIEIISREEMRAEQEAQLEEDIASEDSLDSNVALVFLGYIEEGQDVQEIYAGFISDQVLGWYDAETGQLVVISTDTDEWNATDKTTLFHETVHALQDQHFDIVSLYGDIDTISSDRYTALRSLIEGDAAVAESFYIIQNDLVGQLLQEYEEMEHTATTDIPFFLLETMYFYYDAGGTFVTRIWQEGGWEAVNNVWLNPPTTTEQIIHPEKYMAGEGAIPVAINDPLPFFGEDWRLIEKNEWGQLETRIFLQNAGASSSSAKAASEGWGGDGVYILSNDDETAMVWTSAWDSPTDTDEFVETLVDAESDRLEATVEHLDDNTIRLMGDGWYAEIHRYGDVVTYYLAQTENSIEQLIASQVDAEVQPVGSPVTPENPATPVNKVIFWIREN